MPVEAPPEPVTEYQRVQRRLVVLPSAADRWVMLVVTILMAAPLVTAVATGKVHASALIAFVLFYLLCYYPGTSVALSSAELHGFLRYFFCFTAVPLFFFLLGVSVAALFGYFPILGEIYSRASDGGRSPGIGYGVLVGIGAWVVFWLWYRVLRVLDSLFYAK